ncbi:unnamed protein product [Moneuplotes crassus]|uniref:Uncharacterized protein n=1 Tax=Euplotes crassus TaxID=5936 RepID=A0AAD2D199_EUPCR|nr:unnamed protein product [Moneuplotes crassus]
MKKLLWVIAILALMISQSNCKEPLLDNFRSSPDLNINHNLMMIDKHFKYIVPLIRSTGFLAYSFQGSNISLKEIFVFSNDLFTVILSIFHCDSLSCLTPAHILTKLMREFRLISRSLMSELAYWYKELAWRYGKKLFGVIKKIIATDGMACFEEKSDCIRMRIGQYFMPTFVGNDTSNCSEYDEIIRSFSEQPVDPGIDWTSLCIKLTITLALTVLNYLFLKLVFREWKKTQRLFQLQSNEISMSEIENGALLDEKTPDSPQPHKEIRKVTDSHLNKDREGEIPVFFMF